MGFTELGNCDDFSTETLQYRLAQSGVINYDDDLQSSETSKKPFILKPSKPKTIKGRSSDDSDDDWDCIQVYAYSFVFFSCVKFEPKLDKNIMFLSSLIQ